VAAALLCAWRRRGAGPLGLTPCRSAQSNDSHRRLLRSSPGPMRPNNTTGVNSAVENSSLGRPRRLLPTLSVSGDAAFVLTAPGRSLSPCSAMCSWPLSVPSLCVVRLGVVGEEWGFPKSQGRP